MRMALEKSARRFADAQIGSELKTLWETAESSGEAWLMRGLTDTYLPVAALAKSDRSIQIDLVRIEVNKKGCLFGTIIE